MILVIEIIIGLTTLIIAGIFIVVGRSELKNPSDRFEKLFYFLYFISCFILTILGLIAITGNVEFVVLKISNILYMEI